MGVHEQIVKMREIMQKELKKIAGKSVELTPELLGKMKAAMQACLEPFITEGVISEVPYVIVLRPNDNKNLIKVVLVDKNTKPRFRHDCDACKYIGASDNFDHYWCPVEGEERLEGIYPIHPGSCLARYGNEPDDCYSMPSVLASRACEELRITFEAARQAGVLK